MNDKFLQKSVTDMSAHNYCSDFCILLIVQSAMYQHASPVLMFQLKMGRVALWTKEEVNALASIMNWCIGP